MARLVMPQRFWSKVDIRGPGEYWPWTAYANPGGYGRFGINGRLKYAHRVAWELTRGEIPNGMFVLHHCDNPPCCNSEHPDHLFLGTKADNAADRDKKGRLVPLRVLRGEENLSAKLTEVEVLEIRASDEPNKILAEKYGVGVKAIWRIRARRRWQHLEPRDADQVTGEWSAKLTETDAEAILRSSEFPWQCLGSKQ